MADGRERLSHLLVEDRSAGRDFHRPGRGNPHIRPVEDRAAHGLRRINELQDAFAITDDARDEQLSESELRALGSVITLEGDDPTYPLKLNSLQQLSSHRDPQRKRPKWLLLSVLPADQQAGTPERATVWVNDEYRAKFVHIFESYRTRDSPNGNPRNNELVANITRIRSTILHDLWQSDGQPPEGRMTWWEVWLRPTDTGPDLLRRFAEANEMRTSERLLRLVDRNVMWVESTWAQLQSLPFTAVPVAEIRTPEFVDSVEDLTPGEHAEYVEDLADRLDPADEIQPAVCHLDSGVARTHLLLEESLATQDLHTVVGVSGFDQDGHGTKMVPGSADTPAARRDDGTTR